MSDELPRRTKRRWRLQFSLTTLLVVMTFFGIWLGVQVNRANRQKRAVAAIVAAEGVFRYDYQEPSSGGEMSDAVPPGPTWLRNLIGDDYFCRVVTVDFATGFYGRRKELGLSKIDDDGLRCMMSLPDVKALELGNNRAVTDEGLIHLRNCRNLQTLYLYRSGVSGTGFKYLESLPKLGGLMLNESPVTDEGLRHIGRLRHLTSLDLPGTLITDDGLAHIGQLNELTRLVLDNTEISDAGLSYVSALSNLEYLSLRGTNTTEEGVERLRQSLPHCDIAWGQ